MPVALDTSALIAAEKSGRFEDNLPRGESGPLKL
jgi:hypothetical protein